MDFLHAVGDEFVEQVDGELLGEDFFGADFFSVDIDLSGYLIDEQTTFGKPRGIVLLEHFLALGGFDQIAFCGRMFGRVFLPLILFDAHFGLEIRWGKRAVEYDVEFGIPFLGFFHGEIEVLPCYAPPSVPDVGTAFGRRIEWEDRDILAVEQIPGRKYFPEVGEKVGFAIQFFKRVCELVAVLEEFSDTTHVVRVEQVVELGEKMCVLEHQYLLERVGIVFARHAYSELVRTPERSVFRFALTRFELDFS